MAAPSVEEQTSASPGLPFDPVTLLIGLILRWKVFVGALGVSIVLAAVAAYTLGSQTFEAETISLYKVPDQKDDKTSRTPPISTQQWMVKIPSNLRAVSEKLQLGLAPEKMEKIFTVKVEKRTSLLSITAQWNSARMAANLANTLREVFIANQAALIKADAGSDLKNLETRLQEARKELKQADEKLQAFLSANKIVDLQKEIQWNVDQLTASEQTLSSSENELETAKTQIESLREQIETMKLKVAEEKKLATTQTKGLADLNIRIERLRRAISDDKENRKNYVELEKEELAYERSEELFAKGLISQQDYEKSKAGYEAQKAKTVDTNEIAEWKRQLKVLESEVIPEKEDFKSPTHELLRSLEVKALDLELKELSLKKKLTHVTKRISAIKARLEQLTVLKREQSVLTKDVTAWDTKKSELDQLLIKTRKDYDSPDAGFVLVSAASPPSQSIKSNKKIFFGAVVFLGAMIGSSIILASELLDTTIKSGGEVSSKFSKPVFGIVPKVKDSQLLPGTPDFQLIEIFRIISVHVRRQIPGRGARILITSTDRWEGRTLVTANLAACLGRHDERVLVIDAQIRPVQSELDMRSMIEEKDKPIKGLGEWLSFDAHELDEIVWPTSLVGVECIPRVKAAVTPDLLGSNRMKELMETLSEHFSLILVDGPPVGNYVDAELIAQYCDAVIFTVRSRACTSSALKRSVERMVGTGIPLSGFIVNDVDQLYLKWA